MSRRNGAGARVVPTEDSEPAASCLSDAAATFTPVVPIDDGGKPEREALRHARATGARSPAPADGPGYRSHPIAIRLPGRGRPCKGIPFAGRAPFSLRLGKATPGDDILRAAESLSSWTALHMTLEVQLSGGCRCPVICAVPWSTLLHELASNLQVRRSTVRPCGDPSSELPWRRPRMGK